MLGSTNDPLKVMRRQQQRTQRETRTAQDATGTQPFQVVRKLQQQIDALTAVVAQIIELFRRMPQNDGRQVDEAGFDLQPLTWVKIAEASIPKPEATNRALVSVTALAAVNGKPSPILQPLLQARIRVNGVDGTAVKLTTVYGRSTSEVATCRGSFGLTREIADLTGPVKVELWLHLASMEELFTIDSQAQLSISVAFSRVGT